MAAVVGLVAGVAAPLMVVTAPATAGPIDVNWSASGTGTVTTVSNGSQSAATFTYDAVSFSGSWNFLATSTPASQVGPIKVPWTWSGLHAWFQVTARLDMVVDGAVVGSPLVNAGPAICCTEPSNGFLYGGVATFNLPATPGPHTYGFRLSGSNSDFNNFLRGTFTLSNKPYLDATIGQDNRQWIGAADLPAGGLDGVIKEPGEARWFRFPVVPGQKAQVDLTNLPADYDVALYSDIGAAFERLSNTSDVTQLAAASAAGAPGSETQVPEYPDSVTDIPTSADDLSTTTFAPRIYAPRIYAPRIYAPRIYAPRIYAPRIYAPRIYAPDAYTPDLASDPNFRDAFSAAQNQSLLAISANTDQQSETVAASTGNTDGFFYVRVQGHTDQAFNSSDPFRLTRSIEGTQECANLSSFGTTPTLPPTRTNAATVIVTDTNKLDLPTGSQALTDYQNSLASLAGITNGVVVDVHGSARVLALQQQVADHPECPYAANLLARGIKNIVDSYRTSQNSTLKYVVIAGADDVIPFFRYPDLSGLGEESQFEPPLLGDTPAGASLLQDQVLSQDAYGSRNEVTVGGSTVPVPDLAVGRLVKTPDEIESTIHHYVVDLNGGPLPAPTSSLVTGYDFLADAAHAVDDEFVAATPGGRHDTLIEESGVDPEDSWTGDDLREALLGSRHDLVYLAGHFSANDTLAADFLTTFDAEELDPEFEPDPVGAPGVTNAGKLTDTLVLSAGCHSGYSIVNSAAVPDTTNPFDWTQRMAQQHAVLIGGTGYQYGDTDFMEYSERLYLDVARRLHEGTAQNKPVIAVGNALTLAKQDYLASLVTLTGIDQKAMLQATLYGLPMTGFNAPGRSPLGGGASEVAPVQQLTGPGSTLGLYTDDMDFATPTTSGSKASNAGPNLPTTLNWRNGKDGVTVQPGAPALPKQVENVTVTNPAGLVLRGVGFRSGTYTDSDPLLPLTGAPAIEGSTPNSTFDSDVFFPQRLATANYFGALGASGRTSLILTPAQYRNSAPGADTNIQRTYGGIGVRLFYSGDDSQVFGGNRPSLAAPPSTSQVRGTFRDGKVTFSTKVTGDPSAGVQQVWVTWTGSGTDSGHGTWASVDLEQDADDSTLWKKTIDLPAGQSFAGMRFIVQAANGVGAVGLDTGEGDGYQVREQADDVVTLLPPSTPTADSPFGITAVVTSGQGVPLANRTVSFSVSRSGTGLFTYAAATDANGRVVLKTNAGAPVPPFTLHVRADLYDADNNIQSTAETDVTVFTLGLAVAPASLATRAGTQFASRLVATATNASGQPVADVPVTFAVPAGPPGAAFVVGNTRPTVVTVTTGANGVATSPPILAGTTVGTFNATVSAPGTDTFTVPMAAQYGLTPFGSPVNESKVNNLSTSTLPIKTTALLANDSDLSDAAAAALVQSGQLQLRWRQLTPTGSSWSTQLGLVTYIPDKNLFQADIKSTTIGGIKGRTYEVDLRILAAPVANLQAATAAAQSEFDLGGRSITVLIK